MRIRRLTFYRVTIPLKKTVRHASCVRRTTENVIVACTLDDGTVGWGEGVPREYVTGDTAASCMDLARSVGWSALGHLVWDTLGDAVRDVDRFGIATSSAASERGRGARGQPLRCAVELAVLDAVCRVANEPLWAIARFVPEAAGVRGQRPRVRYSAVITGTTPRRTYWRGVLFRWYGFADCKLKVGLKDAGHDEAVIAAARRGLGPRPTLRVDANEAWDLPTARQRCEMLVRYGVRYVEQPLPADRWDELAELQRTQPLPIVLDESLCTVEDGQRAIELGAGAVFNIRLSKCGGLITAYRLAALAHRAGWGFGLGCQVGESAILSAAGRAFAVSVADPLFCEGSYDRHLLRRHLVRRPPAFGRGGWASALAGPGLGIAVRPERVERMATDKFEVLL